MDPDPRAEPDRPAIPHARAGPPEIDSASDAFAPTGHPEGLATRLHSLAIHLLRRVWARDGETGLSRARASALSVLVFGGPQTLTALAAAEHVTPATMSRLVAALEADGYVERFPHPNDARAVRLVPTSKGRSAMEQARALRIESMLEVLGELKDSEVRSVARGVEALERALGRTARTVHGR